jgi:hypothetical protein
MQPQACNAKALAVLDAMRLFADRVMPKFQ